MHSTTGPAWLHAAGGSVPGRSHLLDGKSNQDAMYWRLERDAAVAVICDGCGSSAHSEVGASIGCRLLTQALLDHLHLLPATAEEALAGGADACLEAARLQVLGHLRALLAGMGGSPVPIIGDLLLFTSVAAIVTPQLALTAALGDGVAAANGDLQILGPFPNNAPPYLAYELLPSPLLNAENLRLRLLHALPANELHAILIGSDGVADLARAAAEPLPGSDESLGELAQFWTDDRYIHHPDMIRRRLARANRRVTGHGGLLPDDTTLIILRRLEPTS